MKTSLYASRLATREPFIALKIELDPNETIDVPQVLHDARRVRTKGGQISRVFFPQFVDVDLINATNAFALGAIADEGIIVMLPAEAKKSLDALDGES